MTVFHQARLKQVDLLIRTSWNRSVKTTDEVNHMISLFDKAQTGTVITTYQTEIPLKDSHKTREATLTVRVSPFVLLAPKNRRKDSPEIPLWILDVREENPPEGVEKIHWMVTTTIEVKTPEEAIEKVTWYMYRWRIEEFHFILKTGAFNIEKLQFETVDRFTKAILMYMIVAWRVLWATYEAREHPNDDARRLFSEEEILALCYREKKIKDTMTVQEAVKALAKLGGYLARYHDGPPGVKSLWLGYKAMQYIVYGMMMEKNR